MPKIKVNAVIERLDYKLRSALEEAVSNAIPDAVFNTDELWLEFVRTVNKKCSIWAPVPDSYIQK